MRPDLAPTARSIAVLPLTNLSGDPEDEYFSDGITDEIITTLAGIRDLRVISRTSVMRYKDTQKSLREIADELGVTHVLVGSGQRDGDRVRIRAQLIDSNTDTNLWAERYDRPLEDIFAVQSEIAQQIARALQARLSPLEQARLERRPTANPVAHDYLLRARAHLLFFEATSFEAALSLLRRARELDATYPDVHEALSEAFGLLYWWVGDPVSLDSAVVAARQAVALDPQFAEGYARLGWILNWRGDREEALEAHRRAVQLNSNLSDGLASLYQFGFGRLDEAAHWWGPALERDPTNGYFHFLAGRTYLELGMLERAQSLLEKAVEFSPEYAWPYYNLSRTLLLQGRPEEAKAQIQRMLAATGETPEALMFAGFITVGMGDLAAARRYLERSRAQALGWFRAQGAPVLAWILQQSGEVERARELIQEADRAFERRWSGRPMRPEDYMDRASISILEGKREAALHEIEQAVQSGWRFRHDFQGNAVLNSLRGDPRFERLMAEVEADVDRMRARVEREGW